MTNSIRFYWNGIRINGEKSLIKCSYSLDNHSEHKECVSIYAHSYGAALPRDLFEVCNESDSYTDYFDTDHAVLTPEHPLYKYARYAAAKAEMRHLPRHIKYLEESYSYYPESRKVEIEAKKARLAEYEAMEDPGQPTASDLEAIYVMRLEAENARKAAEHEAELKAREAMLARQNAGRHYIKDIAKKYPIREGEPVVTIKWSEHPAFCSWDDGELKLSVQAAEIILSHFDKEVHEDQESGYYKTSFRIAYQDENGEDSTYEGRYDLGDNDGGMIEHIRAFGRFYLEKGQFGNGHPTEKDRELGKEIVAFADMLERYTERGKVVHIALAPWVEKVIKAKEQAKQKEIAFVMGVIKQMSDDDLTEAVMSISPADKEREPVVEFFIQQLALRNVSKAMEVYQAWKNQ